MTRPVVEIREPGTGPRQIAVEDRLEVGREGPGVVLADGKVSRRHLELSWDPEGVLTATDLGSTNGTAVNGARISGATVLHVGDVVRVGDTEISVLRVPDDDAPSAPGSTGPPVTGPATAPPATDPVPAAVPARPALDELESRAAEGAVLRYRPGTAGGRAVDSMARAVRRARRRLAGLGSEPWGAQPQICLVDPFPHPSEPDQIVASGTLVDSKNGEIWMAVTAESPPEAPERPLAILFGAALPAAAELRALLEGFGLVVSDAPDPDPGLRRLDLPPLENAEGELGSAMAQSFVAYLLDRGNRSDFLRLLSEARPGTLETTAKQIYGVSLSALEEEWLEELATPGQKVPAGQFLRLTLRYLRPHRRREAEIFVYMILSLGFTMIFPFVMRRLLDDAIPSRQLSGIVGLVGILALAFVVSLLAGLRQTYLSAYVSSAVIRDVREEMFTRLQRLSSRWFNRQQQGDVLSRLFNDVEQMEDGVSDTLREGLFQVLSLIVSAAVLLALQPVLGALVILGAPLVAVVYRVMSEGARRRSMAVQEQMGNVVSIATENYGAQPVVKAFALEATERRRFREASNLLFSREIGIQLFGGLFSLSVNMIATSLRLVVLGLGAWLVVQDRLTIGGLVAFTTLMGEVITPVSVLTGLGQRLQVASGSLVRINEVLEATPDVDDPADAAPLPPLQQEIRLVNVAFSYTPERRTLDGINCTIPAGKRVAFVGPTGAGKSSVLQLLMRFYDVDDGAVLFDGRDIRSVKLSSVRQQLGVVFQDTFLFDSSIKENIALGRPGATDAEIEGAARAAELHDFVMTLPRGYGTVVGERGSRLSGGQRQRLAIARALIRDPRVLLLDEATSALDSRTERLISDTLERVGEGRTTISVTHRLTSLTRYDVIFVIVDGRLVEQGSHDDLVTRGGVYAQLWAEQVQGHVASEPPFDAAAALGAVPVFAGLSVEERVAAARRLRVVELQPGEQLAEGGGGIALVRRGRPEVMSRALGGELVATTRLEPGDAFGVAALMGDETGMVLSAPAAVTLLVLDDEHIRALAARHPSVAAALAQRVSAGVGPAEGRRLSRFTLPPPSLSRSVDPGGEAAGPPPEQLRRASGAFPALRP